MSAERDIVTLDDTIELLTRVMNHPCACDACKEKSRHARNVLMTAPDGDKLMEMDHNTEEFREIERKFRWAERDRLLRELSIINALCCHMLPRDEHQRQIEPVISDDHLPQDTPNERLQQYMQRYRQAKIEMLKNPKIPGTYVIK